MTNNEAIQILLDDAGNALNKITDPYQHARLALEIAKTISATGVTLTELVIGATKESEKAQKAEAKTKKTAEKTELKGKPVSQKEAQGINEMLSVPNKAEQAAAATLKDGTAIPADAPIPAMTDLQSSPALINMNPRAQISSAAPAPTPASAAPAKREVDITSDEWKNKHLTPDEVDDTWTEAMKANVEMLQSAKVLRQVCVNGVQAGKIDSNWLNARISEASDGMFTSYEDRNIYNPPVVRMISAYVAGKVNELFRKAA